MQKNLTLKYEGGYVTVYKRKERIYSSYIKAFLSDFFSSLGIDFEEKVRVCGLEADFLVNGRLIFCRDLKDGERERLVNSKTDFVSISVPKFSASRNEILALNDGEEEGHAMLFMDDPSFNFDYAHILPHTKKCSVMHGHTSSVLVEITGRTINGMVVDFGDAKNLIRNIVKDIDHKLFISKKYVVAESKNRINLRFKTVHGTFEIDAPKRTTILMDGEATSENLARYLVNRIAIELPENVTSVGVYVYEGMNKGAYVLANIHGS